MKKEDKVKENKNNKKSTKSVIKLENENAQFVKKFIIILLVVVALVFAIYYFTRLFVSKDLIKEEEKTTETEVQFDYSKTILGSLFNRPYDEYYVIVYKQSDDKSYELSEAAATYTQKENAIKIYYADLDDYMNKSFYDPENINTKAENVEQLKVGDYTLIKIKDQKISKYIQDIEKIKKELGVQ